MEQKESQRVRERAWLLIQDTNGIADAIKALDTRPNDDVVIIRVDSVEALNGSLYNLVVPIDTKDVSTRNGVVKDVKALIGDAAIEVFEVVTYDPSPPHTADGYIHADEAAADKRRAEEIIKIGRQRNSPGDNPWG